MKIPIPVINRSLAKVTVKLLLLFAISYSMSAQAVNTGDANNNYALTAEEKAWLIKGYTVRVRVSEWPPFMFTDGEVRGISIDYLTKIFAFHGIKYELITDPDITWNKSLDYIKQRLVVDMVPTAKITEERKEFMVFTDEYLIMPWVIFSRTDSEFIGGIDDLKGKTIELPKGYALADLIAKHYPEINLKLIEGNVKGSDILRDLATGKTDAHIGNLVVGTYLAESLGFTNIKVAAPTPFGNHNQAMGIRKDWPELASIINKSLNSFTSEDHAAIRNKWLTVKYEFGIHPRDILEWSAIAAFAILVAFTVFYYWNKRLAKEIELREQAEEELQEYSRKLEEMVDNRTKSLLEAREQLARRDKLASLGKLAGSLGHELRKPLSVISNATFYLSDNLPELDKVASEQLEIIGDEIKGATKMIEDLLDFGRVQSQGKVETTLTDIIDQVMKRNPMPGKVTFQPSIAKDLPKLNVDPGQIQMILNNLVVNAIQAMPDGGTLSIEAELMDSEVCVSVSDTGVGISSENMEKLFEPLFTTKQRGIGLGLALSKSIAEVNDCTIDVESAEGKGSTFKVCFKNT